MNLIYITGVTSTGKTTAADKLGKYMDVPVIHIDHIYNIMGRKVGYKNPAELVFPEKWKQIDGYKDLKKDAFKHLLETEGKDRKDTVIIEGFTLFFQEEREMVESILNPNWITMFKLKPDFETWAKQRMKKYGSTPHYDSWLVLNKRFESPNHYYEIKDPDVLQVHYLAYQKKGFTDIKWKALDLQNLEGKTILDAGCNEGMIGKWCLENGAKSVDGIDRNWRYLEIARQNGLNTHLMDLEDVSKLGKKYDIVLCLATMHYIWNKEKFIKEVSEMTDRFVVEIPVLEEAGLKCGKKHEVLIPTPDMMIFWLERYFDRAEIVGESPAPDDSHRLVFKAYKDV